MSPLPRSRPRANWAGGLIQHLLTVLFLLSVLAIASLLLRPSPYYVISPGGTYDIGERLVVPEERRREMGRLAFTAVYAQEGSWADVLGARLNRNVEVVPAEQVRPPDVSQEQLNQINQQLIDESKPVAAVVALRAAGYQASITGQGAEVTSLAEDMPAALVLQAGDVILAVNDTPTPTGADVGVAVQRRQPGDRVAMLIQREGETRTVEVGTVASPTDPTRAMIGVRIRTQGFDVDLPFPVEIDTGSVGGPSAGAMFALGILDAVTEGDLTRGRFVAGTGTIAVDGTVGDIGGAAEKVVSAERDGADVFFVSQNNYEEARQRARRIAVVPLARLEDAVRYLCGLEPRDEGPLPSPCAPLAP